MRSYRNSRTQSPAQRELFQCFSVHRVEYDTRVARDLASLDDLWNSTPVHGELIDHGQLSPLPAAARKYLEHAIAPGTRSASAVRFSVHGQIKVKGWLPFSAEQVIRWDQGMVWRAVVRMHDLQIRATDTFLGAKAPCDGSSSSSFR